MDHRLAALLAASLLIVASAAGAQQQTRVAFAPGQTSATFAGRIAGRADHRYIVDARAGQKLVVGFRPGNSSAYFNVTAPGADAAMFIGASGGNRFAGPVAVSGPHVVLVYLMRNAARRGETADYRISIGLRDAAPPPRASRDALVPGTKYHATADIPCITAASGMRATCTAGVTRKSAGEATVVIETPAGPRSIWFRNGRPAGSNAATPIAASRRDDWHVIRIGRRERYEIPDAFLTGG